MTFFARKKYRHISVRVFIIQILLLLFPLNNNAGNTFVVHIDKQSDFDYINNSISKAISEGNTDIQVIIKSGIYYFKENHIKRVNENHPNITISIQGENAIIIADGKNYRNKELFKSILPYEVSYIDTESLQPLNFWTECNYADGLAEVVNKEKKICRIYYKNIKDVDASQCSNLYISITRSYRSIISKVIKISNGYIYFLADEVETVKKGSKDVLTINYDYVYGNQKPRFRLYAPTSSSIVSGMQNNTPNGNRIIHKCKACRFLYLNNCTYKSFNLSEIHFLGNSANSELLRINKNNSSKTTISDCTFESIQSVVGYVLESSNVTFANNTIINCSHTVFESTNLSENTHIIDNSFKYCGTNMTQTFSILCRGSNYYIARNRISNFGYAAIGVGVWYGHQKEKPSYGIIENNEIWYEGKYLQHPEKYTLMDSGAIYLWTQQDGTIIQNNYIHDYVGMHYNHGIYCDDGANNFKLLGNVILNASDNSIDSRACPHILPIANHDIEMKYNIVDKPIKFQGSTQADNRCLVSYNVMLYQQGKSIPQNIYSHLKTVRADEEIQYTDKNDKGITISKKSRKAIKKILHYNHIQDFFRIFAP